jgi:sulfur-oxidizing protein SoxZ
MAPVRVNVPRKARRGEVIEIKTLASHPMETGYRRDNVGNPIPRNIICQFRCTYNGVEVFRADFFPAVAANPFLSFFTVADESGTVEFQWIDDHGNIQAASASIEIE